MHVSDGFLDAKTAVAAGVLAAAGVGTALAEVRRRLPPRRLPLLGTAAAFVFAAQMLNFPVAGGTSGHLLGGALAAALLGPAAAVVVITSVLIVQCLLFADGGVTALGANVFTMALVGVVGAWVPYRIVRRLVRGPRGRVAAAAFAGWCSVMFSATVCAGMLAFSGTAPWGTVLPAMAGAHTIIGAGEGIITALVVAAVLRARPELVDDRAGAAPMSLTGAAAIGLVVALGLAVFVAPHASPWPDGLETVAAALGFQPRAAEPLLGAPLPDYAVPGLESPWITLAVAGTLGTLVAFALAWGLGRALVPGRAEDAR